VPPDPSEHAADTGTTFALLPDAAAPDAEVATPTPVPAPFPILSEARRRRYARLEEECIRSGSSPGYDEYPDPGHDDLDMNAWLGTRGLTFPRDSHCWRTYGIPGKAPPVNDCRCHRELKLPTTESTFLECERIDADKVAGPTRNTVLYVVEKKQLRAVLDIPTGTTNIDFEVGIPAIIFRPFVVGDAIVFRGDGCWTCAINLERANRETNWELAVPEFTKICAAGSREYHWSNGQLLSRAAPTSAAAPGQAR
jgi:hypothetical protein